MRVLFLVGGLLLACPAVPQTAMERWRTADVPTQQAALKLARQAFDTFILRRETIAPPDSLPPLLQERAALFVSAMRKGAPRCCMGTLYPMEPDAAREIIANAVMAAGRDRRFPPIRPSERAGLTLIVSIVSRPRPITEAEFATLDPVKDGLAVRANGKFGVVLSGETTQRKRMLAWGRIRAGAKPGTPVQLFRLDVTRFLETK